MITLTDREGFRRYRAYRLLRSFFDRSQASSGRIATIQDQFEGENWLSVREGANLADVLIVLQV